MFVVAFLFLSVCGTIVGESTPAMVPKNKTRHSYRFLYLLPVFMAVFMVPFPAFAQAVDPVSAFIGDRLVWAFNCLLYAVYGVVSLTVVLGAVVMEYSLNPVAFSGLFNMQAVYDLWGMVRDFFNLFFILMILFIAFSTIFQVQAYNYKKLLWHLVLMALLTNFSFPVSRFLIDAANVPMYFFLESTVAGDSDAAGKEISNRLFSAAKMRSAILPEVDGWEDITGDQKLSQHLVRGIIFIFIFGVSLLVLAVLLLLRTITLLVLVIFSPVGFSGAAIPWFSSYSKKWWDALMSNAFFGPTAALMLLVSVRIVSAFSSSTSNTELQDIAKNSELGEFNVANMATLIIPVTLIWMSISVGKSFSIAGAGTVIGKAEKFAKSTGRKFSGADKMQRNWKEYKKVRETRANAKFQASNIGARAGRFNDRLQNFAGRKLALTTGSRNFARDQAETAQQARIKEEATKNRINDRMSDAELESQLVKARNNSLSVAHLTAVTQEMAKREHMAGKITAADKTRIDEHFKDMGGVTNAVAKDTKEAIAKHNAQVAYGDDVDAMQKAFLTGKIKMEDQAGNTISANLLTASIEANKLDQKILEELHKDSSKAAALSGNLDAAVENFENRYVTRYAAATTPAQEKAINKQRVNAHQTYLSQEGIFHSTSIPSVQQEVYKKADATTMRNVSAANMASHAADIAKYVPSGKQATLVSGIAEQDTVRARALISEMKARESSGDMDAHDVVVRLRRDGRTRGLL